MIGLPFWLVSNILIWLPPSIPPQSQAEISTVLHLPSGLWYWGFSFIRSISSGLMMISLSSVLPEISQSMENRLKISNISANLMTTVSVINIVLPLIIQSLLEDPQHPTYWSPSGQFLTYYMPRLALGVTLVAAILVICSFFSIDESFHLKSNVSFKKKSIRSIFKNMILPIKDKEYVKFLGGNVVSQASRMIMGISFMPFLIFVIGFSGTQFYWYIIINVTAKYGWLFIWTRIVKKNKNLLKIYRINILITAAASFAELVFLVDMSFGFRVYYLILSYLTVIGATNAYGLFYSPIMTEIIDVSAEKIVKSSNIEDRSQAVTIISGAYYGLFSFSVNIATSFVSFIYGFIYQGDNSTNPNILTLGLASMSLYYLIAWFFFRSMKLKFRNEVK
jgi:Na+/melibiose symporter-like transporter